jgi:hypothetical protein
MGDINSFFSDKMSHKRNRFKCCLENCNKPVTHLLISMYIHVNGAACDSCKKELDKESIVDQKEAFLKNSDKEGKIKNTKIKENAENEHYAIDADGPPSAGFDIPILEWVRIYD